MTSLEELFQLSDAAANVRANVQDKDLKKQLSDLESACGEAARAWSGSNLGYHATVYYEDLAPKPPHVHFSSEWGLEPSWPVNQPDPGWVQYDNKIVSDEIVRRAGDINIGVIEASLTGYRREFFDLRERAVSLLTVLQGDPPDPFLARKLKHVDSLRAPQRGEIAKGLVGGPSWSRDSLAVSQQHRVAPHQSLIAIPLAAAALANGLENLEKAARESALHVERIDQRRRKMTATGKTVFIGHGREPIWRELKDFLKDRLHLSVEEFNSSSPAGIPTAMRLEEMLDRAAFAFLVMTAEDQQPDGRLRARENVVHEAGLFQGRLGFRKAIILLEETCDAFSNIEGLGQIRFSKGKVSAKFEEIRSVLEREGLIPAP